MFESHQGYIFRRGEVIFTDDINLIIYVTDKTICHSSIILSFTVGLLVD